MDTPLFQPRRSQGIIPAFVVAFCLACQLGAAPTPPSASYFGGTGYLDTKFGTYSMRSYGSSWTSTDWNLGGAYSVPLDSLSSTQFDFDYTRLSPGRGLAGGNAYDFDLHYTRKYDDIPLGGFLGYSKNGNSTWGGGLESTIPIGKYDWHPGCHSPTLDNSLLNLQGTYARTSTSSTNLWGLQSELRLFPTDDFRLSAQLGYQHKNSTFGRFSNSDNICNFGAGAEYRLPNMDWSLYGDYQHTYFHQSGMKVDGFNLGVRYCPGRSLRSRETEGPAMNNFSRTLGIAYKF